MHIFTVKCKCCIHCFSGCINCTSCHCCITDLKVADSVFITCLCKSTSVTFLSTDCKYCRITWEFNFFSVFFADHNIVTDFSYFYGCNRDNAGFLDFFTHTYFSCCSHIRTDIRKHFENAYFRSLFCQIFCCFHADHTATDHNNISCSFCFTV